MKTFVMGLAALAFQGQTADPDVAFKLVETGTQNRLKEGGAFVMRSDAEYRAYLRRRGNERRRAPQVDFRANQLVAIHIGEQPTEGYTLRVLRVIRKGPVTDVEVSLDRLIQIESAQILRDPQTQRNGEPFRVNRAPTFPYVIVRTERFPGDVRVRIVEPDDKKKD